MWKSQWWQFPAEPGKLSIASWLILHTLKRQSSSLQVQLEDQRSYSLPTASKCPKLPKLEILKCLLKPKCMKIPQMNLKSKREEPNNWKIAKNEKNGRKKSSKVIFSWKLFQYVIIIVQKNHQHFPSEILFDLKSIPAQFVQSILRSLSGWPISQQMRPKKSQ